MDRARLSSSCRAKLARADQHLKQLYDEIDRWSNLDPCRVIRESNAEGSEHVFRMHLAVQPDVWRWGVLLDDALHNLRCALDHIVYSLAISNTGQDPPDDDARLEFPICSAASYFAQMGVRQKIAALSGAAQAGIERTQPYNRLKATPFQPLWWLSQLNNVDKHRLTMLLPLAAHPDWIKVGAADGTYRIFRCARPLIDGAPVLWLRLSEPNPNVEVHFHLTAAVVLQAEGQPPLGVIHMMRAIRRETAVVCRYLTLFL